MQLKPEHIVIKVDTIILEPVVCKQKHHIHATHPASLCVNSELLGATYTSLMPIILSLQIVFEKTLSAHS
jgi:hypothetical protein